MERRTFLVLGAVAVGLAGCTSDSTDPGPPSAPAGSSAPRDPDGWLRDEVAASEVALIAAYRSAIRATPELAADLAPFVAQHQAHLDRVAPAYPGAADASGVSGSEAGPGSPSGPGSPFGPGSPSVPAERLSAANPSSVLAALADAESEAQAQRAAACDGVQDPGLARELCLIAASEAQHATALEALAAEGAGS